MVKTNETPQHGVIAISSIIYATLKTITYGIGRGSKFIYTCCANIIHNKYLANIIYHLWLGLENILFKPLEKILGLALHALLKQIIAYGLLFFVLWLLLHNTWPFTWLFTWLLKGGWHGIMTLLGHAAVGLWSLVWRY